MNSEKKRLVLEVMTTPWGKLLRVKEQTHSGATFGAAGPSFWWNRFRLYSLGHPGSFLCGLDGLGLYLQGSDKSKDNELIVVPSEEWLDKCREAVRAYNEFFSGEKEEVQPTPSDSFTIETIE